MSAESRLDVAAGGGGVVEEEEEERLEWDTGFKVFPAKDD